MSEAFSESLCYQQVTITDSSIVVRSIEDGEEKQMAMDANAWSFPLLRQEQADKVIIRRYTFLTGDKALNKRAVANEMKGLGVTHAHPTDKGFITYSIFDGDTVRRFGDLRTIVINRISEKMFKRLSLLNVMSYLNASYSRDSVNIKFVEGVSGPHVDGEVYISEAFRLRVAIDMHNRVSKKDPVKARRLFEQAMDAGTFNTGRALVFEGLIKGDFVVACDDKMDGADILVHVDDNLKTEVRHAEQDGFIVTMMPNKQAKSVRTNRQVLSLIGEHLLGKDVYLAVGNFDQKFEEHLAKIAAGQHVPVHRETPEAPGAIDGTIDKAHVWYDTFGTLANSRYLTSMVAGQFVNQNTPPVKEEDRKRRFPVPFARSYSIRSEHSYEMMYGRPCPVKPGHILLDKNLGAVAADDILVECLAIAGGADLDDKINLHYRLIDGVLQAIIIRDPMTADMDVDGTTMGLEYQVRPVHGYGVSQSRGVAHGEIPPVWDASQFPKTVAEITAPPESLTATPRTFPSQYDNQYAWAVIQENLKDSFGGFANLLMAYVHLNIPFRFVAKGETLIDICQQSRNPVDLAAISSYVHRLKLDLAREIEARGIQVDYYLAKRAGILDLIDPSSVLPREEGLMGKAIASHKAIVANFESQAGDVVRTITHDIRTAMHEPLSTVRTGGQTMSTGAWLEMKLRTSLRGTGMTVEARTEEERNRVGNHMAAFLEAKVDTGQLTREEMLELVRQMFLWAHLPKEDLELLPEGAKESIIFSERFLYWGSMFRLLVEALQNGPFTQQSEAREYDESETWEYDEPEVWELDGPEAWELEG